MAYREIVTKAVVGKGRKYYKNVYDISVSDDVSNVLGCWIINHTFKGREENGHIVIEGKFDCNIWYSYDNDSKTAVVNQKIDYNDLFNVKIKDDADLSGDTDIVVRSLTQPSCSKVNIVDDNHISFEIDKELGIEIVGETKVKIAIEADEEPWEEILDDVDDKTLEEIEKVDENYIK